MVTFPLYLLLMVVSVHSFDSLTSDTSLEEHCHTVLATHDPESQEEIPWYCMCGLCQDSQGSEGDSGGPGHLGFPGIPGSRGVTGYRGPPGSMGIPGIKGQKGYNGGNGAQGAIGPAGGQGVQGFKGEGGDQGLKGYPGEQGPKGEDGVCPEFCEPTFGPPGAPGLTGPVGNRGQPGATGLRGPKGNAGDKGDVGFFGAPGHAGEKGELGPEVVCNCIDGVDGHPGPKGETGDKGNQGQQGPTGEVGVQFKGEKGIIGPVGPPGSCMPDIRPGFFVGLVSSYPPPGMPVLFSRIHFNQHESYNTDTGEYKAPTTGVYVFSYNLAIHTRFLIASLYHNAKVIVQTTLTQMSAIGSQTVALHLEKDDKVWIGVKDLENNGMYTSADASSTFSGFLLYQDSCIMENPFPIMLNITSLSGGGPI